MSRLRYNGLATGAAGSPVALSLGAALTNSGTTITFNAALTYQNGTAVPTIVSPDVIPLSIMDSTGAFVLEVVYLTAYTAAATTGTILRAQEGFAGVAHTSGDKIVHAATVFDIAPVRSVDDPADPSWGADLGYDLEFDTDTSTLPSGYSWVNQGSATYTQRFGAGVIDAVTGERLLVRTLPTGTGWAATSKIGGTQNSENSGHGLVLRESSSGKYAILQKGSPTTLGRTYMAIDTFSAIDTFVSEPALITNTQAVQYLRIKHPTSTTYTFEFSDDGVAWKQLLSAWTQYAVFDQIGFYCIPNSTKTQEFSWHWFRVR